jgi:small subunit ribosomal protein S16
MVSTPRVYGETRAVQNVAVWAAPAAAIAAPVSVPGIEVFSYTTESRRYRRVLAIRLARYGKKKKPFYRVVVMDKRRPRNGRFVEIVGTYDPLKKPLETRLDAERIRYWLGRGAQPSDTVRSLLRRGKIA